MKTKEELDAIRSEVETVRGKLSELSEEELGQVVGGGVGSNGTLIAAQLILVVPALGIDPPEQ